MYQVKISKYTGAVDADGHKVRTVLNINGIEGITLPHDTEIRLDVPEGDYEAAAQYLSIGKLIGVTEGLPETEGEKNIVWGAGGHKILIDPVAEEPVEIQTFPDEISETAEAFDMVEDEAAEKPKTKTKAKPKGK